MLETRDFHLKYFLSKRDLTVTPRLIFSVRRISKSKRKVVQKCYIAATRRRRRQIVTENRNRAVSTWHIGRIPISHSMTAVYHPRNPLSAGMEGGFNNNPSGWQDSRVGPDPLLPTCGSSASFDSPPPHTSTTE